jgi:hypothetical protein
MSHRIIRAHPRPPKGDLRLDKAVSFKVAELDLAEIDAHARKLGQQRSDWLRDLVLDSVHGRIADPATLARLQQELERLQSEREKLAQRVAEQERRHRREQAELVERFAAQQVVPAEFAEEIRALIEQTRAEVREQHRDWRAALEEVRRLARMSLASAQMSPRAGRDDRLFVTFVTPRHQRRTSREGKP